MSTQTLERPTQQTGAAVKQAIADCDIHPRTKSRADLHPYLSKRWLDHINSYGTLPRLGYEHGRAYPKSQPAASRRDAWPPNGGRPGSDLPFMREQLLDAYDVQLGILNFAGENGQYFQNQELGGAFSHAINEWLKAEWTSKEPRLKASIVVPYENAAAAVEEIELRADDKEFAQILFQSRSSEPFGKARYWPIYEAAVRTGLPVGIHAFGYGGYPITSGGWPSFYIEEMVNHAQSCQSLLTSMVFEGVFERFPTLKVVLVESGFGWLPPLCWRLDKVWKRMRDETPHLKRLPSEYIRDQVYITTQPMEEPLRAEHLLDTIRWIGWDKVLFATDYPHWDFDDPKAALPKQVGKEQRAKILLDNALKLYGAR